MGHPQRKATEAFGSLNWVWALNATEDAEWEDLMEAAMEVWAAAKQGPCGLSECMTRRVMEGARWIEEGQILKGLADILLTGFYSELKVQPLQSSENMRDMNLTPRFSKIVITAGLKLDSCWLDAECGPYVPF